MSHFLKRIETSQGYLNFYINSIYTPDGVRFHISVIDKTGKANTFYAYSKDDRWLILEIEKQPNWIQEVAIKLEKAIFKHLSE
jgi:hypothetical protein